MKTRTFLSRINIWVIYFFFTAIVFGIVAYSVVLIKELRVREIKRIEVFAKAMKIQQSNGQIAPDTQDLLWSIFTENDQIPMIVTNEKKQPILEEGYYRNIPDHIVKDSVKLKKYIEKMGNTYRPFEISIAKGDRQFVFYDNSQLLNNLQYYPFFLGAFILAYLIFSIWFLKTVKKTDEGFVWAGLAKETAHQIGTPLSSMFGWIEIMKMEHPESLGIKEIEKDVLRLKTISERFSKIGSVPELNDYHLNETVQQNYDYMKNRISTKVDFKLEMPKQEILVPHNRILFSWVIENLVKNAVDAMKGKGSLSISLYEKNNFAFIDIKDSGSGMTGTHARSVFKPGYSTKSRGWGLGLSLAKRVVKDYHNGDITVAQTAIDKGTTFRIRIKISEYH